MLTNKEIYAALKQTLPSGIKESVALKIITDTCEIADACVFVALKGENFDGHDFIATAIKSGATYIIAEKLPKELLEFKDKFIIVNDCLLAYQALAAFYRLKFSLPLIAITGSNGKTSTKDILYSALSENYCVLKNRANFNNEIGVPKTLFDLNADHQVAIVEMGMRGLGQIAQLTEMARPKIAIITTIAPTHIELLGSLENIAKAKAEIFKDFGADNLVILNYDNSYTRSMKPNCKTVFFGLESAADLYATDIESNELQTKFICHDKLRNLDYKVIVPLIGRHNISNTLAALAVASYLNIDLEKVLVGLAKAELSSMRQSIEHYLDNIIVINDAYNASPVSMQMALESLATVGVGRRKIAVLGDMLELGEFAPALHAQVGEYCVINKIDIVYTYGDFANEINKVARDSGIIAEHFLDKNSLAVNLKKNLQADDVLLFKGSRGMKMEELIEMIFKK